MKTLYLVRHAKSDWADLSLKDFDRPLNARGNRVAPKVGNWLREKDEVPQLVISSPSKRTTQTSESICEQLGIPFSHVKFVDSIYEASTRELLGLINTIENKFESVMIICHNMAVTYVSEYLTGGDIGNVPTCGVLKMNFDFDSWDLVSEKTADLEFFLQPTELDF